LRDYQEDLVTIEKENCRILDGEIEPYRRLFETNFLQAPVEQYGQTPKPLDRRLSVDRSIMNRSDRNHRQQSHVALLQLSEYVARWRLPV
jgi:hypothetical protein